MKQYKKQSEDYLLGFFKGELDHDEGLTLSENPYSVYSDEYYGWTDGWEKVEYIELSES